MLPFSVHIQDGEPVSDQLVRAVRRAILSGELADGDLFPSVRALSQELHISPTTAHKVVSQLKAAGYLTSRPGIGMVITSPRGPSRDERLTHLRPACIRLLKEAAAVDLGPDDALDALRRAAAELSGTGLFPDGAETREREDTTQ